MRKLLPRFAMPKTVLAFLSVSAVAAGVLVAPTFADTGNTSNAVNAVNVNVTYDGTISQVKSSTTSLKDGQSPEEKVISTQDYDPSAVAPSLPVRVLTAYTYEDKVGSDINSLKGVSGRVRIDVTLQNTTSRPQQVSFDSNGQSISRQELVGVPLTVVASTKLKNIAPSQILLNKELNKPLTNGVVSQGEKGESTVQWAAILAPPLLPSSSTFSLVVDTKDFQVPEFDISVQPGFVTDATYKGIVKRATSVNGNEDSKAITRTIAVLSQVGDVLAESGSALGNARRMLDSSAKTIGVKTINDLTMSNDHIVSSARDLSSLLKSLNSSLSAQLQTTSSSVIGELLLTTQKMNALLGDTSISAPQAQIDGSTCLIKLDKDKEKEKFNGVFGVVSSLSERLRAYSKASSDCRESLRQKILDSLGPENPTVEQCQNNESLTCGILASRVSMNEVVEKLKSAGKDVLGSLSSEPTDLALQESGNLQKNIALMEEKVQSLKEKDRGLNIFKPEDEKNLEKVLTDSATNVVSLRQQIKDLNAGMRKIAELSEKQSSHLTVIKDIVCVESGQTIPKGEDVVRKNLTIKKESADKILRELSSSSCPSKVGADDGTEQFASSSSADSAAVQQRDVLQELIRQTSTVAGAQPSELQRDLNYVDISLSDAQKAFESLKEARLASRDSVADKVALLDEALSVVKKNGEKLSGKVQEVHEARLELLKNTNLILEETAKKLTDSNEEIIAKMAEKTKQVEQNLDGSASSLLGNLEKDLQESAQGVEADGAKTIDDTKAKILALNSALGIEAEKKLAESDKVVTNTLDAAVQNSDGAAQLLSADISRVLADIGNGRERGSGLLGTIASSSAQLVTADVKLSDSTTNMSSYLTRQRGSLDDYLLYSARLRASLARLESIPKFPSLNENVTLDEKNMIDVFAFRIGGGK
ncbi:hypothetical protein KRX54_01365 [Actinomycetaceae bacterium TAE3-ERU4]|nr:hypothetical protein [Actinomycetaceae bacterium TAE3-ERU4]